jgi:hypothetical protein
MCSPEDIPSWTRRPAKLAAFRGCGGIGLRARFRSVWAQALGGSSPSSRTGVRVHSEGTVREALELAATGLHASGIAAQLGIPRSTVRDWLEVGIPHTRRSQEGYPCRTRHEFVRLPPSHVYLLGLYLGDGCISSRARGVYRLRIVLDTKYRSTSRARPTWQRSTASSGRSSDRLGHSQIEPAPATAQSQPRSSATRTASARLRASSFCITEERWLRTVPGER